MNRRKGGGEERNIYNQKTNTALLFTFWKKSFVVAYTIYHAQLTTQIHIHVLMTSLLIQMWTLSACECKDTPSL